MSFVTIPYTEGLVARNLDLGLLAIYAFASVNVLGLLLGAWGSRNKYAVISAARVVSQNVAYEIPMFFKLAVFPFHFWAPDVYQGASNDTTAFIASIPKIVAVAVLARFCSMAYPGEGHVALLLTGLSIASMCYGNLTALVQTDVKRMLGFSGIAHAGYILMGMATLQGWGIATALYYATGYLFMMLAAFLVLCVVSPDGRNLSIKDLNGLSRRSPMLAFVLGVSMFALAGIPPFVGFMGKFMLLTGAWRAGHTALVIIAAINTAIGIYYYLQVVRAVYTEAALHVHDGAADAQGIGRGPLEGICPAGL